MIASYVARVSWAVVMLRISFACCVSWYTWSPRIGVVCFGCVRGAFYNPLTAVLDTWCGYGWADATRIRFVGGHAVLTAPR